MHPHSPLTTAWLRSTGQVLAQAGADGHSMSSGQMAEFGAYLQRLATNFERMERMLDEIVADAQGDAVRAAIHDRRQNVIRGLFVVGGRANV